MITHISIINDCLDADARLRIESQVKKLFREAQISFYGVPIFSTLSLSFLITEGDFHENELILFNSAPRNKEELHEDNRSGELVFLKLKTGAWAVGPNEGLSLALIEDMIEEIWTDSQDRANKLGTQFRSAYTFPKMAHTFLKSSDHAADGFIKEDLASWPFPKHKSDKIVWIDSFGNIKTSVTKPLEEKEYNVKISRDGKELVTLTLPFYPRLTAIPMETFGLIRGSSFKEQGIELIYRDCRPGQKTTTRILEDKFGVHVLPEDDIEIL